jgi:hypothetical protein
VLNVADHSGPPGGRDLGGAGGALRQRRDRGRASGDLTVIARHVPDAGGRDHPRGDRAAGPVAARPRLRRGARSWSWPRPGWMRLTSLGDRAHHDVENETASRHQIKVAAGEHLDPAPPSGIRRPRRDIAHRRDIVVRGGQGRPAGCQAAFLAGTGRCHTAAGRPGTAAAPSRETPRPAGVPAGSRPRTGAIPPAHGPPRTPAGRPCCDRRSPAGDPAEPRPHRPAPPRE